MAIHRTGGNSALIHTTIIQDTGFRGCTMKMWTRGLTGILVTGLFSAQSYADTSGVLGDARNIRFRGTDTTAVSGSMDFFPAYFKTHRGFGQPGIEVGIDSENARDHQQLVSNEYIALDSRGDYNQPDNRKELTGPQLISNVAHIEQAHLGFLHKFELHHIPLAIEPCIGIGYGHLDVSATTADDASSLHYKKALWGMYVGIASRWAFNQYLSAQLKLKAEQSFFVVSDAGQYSAIGTNLAIEPAVVVMPSKKYSSPWAITTIAIRFPPRSIWRQELI